MTKQFTTKAEAEAAIKAAIAKGRIVSGHAVLDFSGHGGATVYRAHVRTAGGTSFCL